MKMSEKKKKKKGKNMVLSMCKQLEKNNNIKLPQDQAGGNILIETAN